MRSVPVQRFTFPSLHCGANPPSEDSPEALALAAAAAAAELVQQADLELRRAAAVAAGHEAGFAAGLVAGRAAAVAQVDAECRARAQAVQRIEAALTRVAATIDADLGAAVVRVVAQLVESTVEVELLTNCAVIRHLADMALTHLREAVGPLTLHLHPQDRALLESAAPTVAAAPLAMRDDATLARGEVRLETAEGSVEVSLRERLTAALAVLQAEAP